MAFQLSPGVLVQEQDASNVVPSVATTIGGFAGNFNWGPADEIITVASENQLVDRFGRPNTTANIDFLTAASFLAYGSALKVVRTVGAAQNATASGGALLIKNKDVFEAGGHASVGVFAAKYPGSLGNSLKVAISDSTTFGSGSVASIVVGAAGSGYTSAPTVAFSGGGTPSAVATGTAILSGSTVGSINVTFAGLGYTSAPTIAMTGGGGSGAAATATMVTAWTYANQFDDSPGTSSYATNNSTSLDEIHVIVIDEDGAITGRAGTVLEKFAGVSKASDAKDDSNQSNYYADVINNRSKWVWALAQPTNGTDWGTSTVGNTSFVTLLSSDGDLDNSLSAGADAAPTDGNKTSGYDLFANDELVDVNLLIGGGHSATVQDAIIDNVAEIRKDCMVFVSPQSASVVNNAGSEATSLVAELASYTRSSYASMDSGWKYMYDKYNDKYRWIPCSADIAGACVTADATADPWFSPAGTSRGAIKNAVKLAYSPSKADRDTLYKAGINPVVGSVGSGIILFGDKTLLNKNSAFNRINVRRLFITVEKAIATAAKFQLFEFNDGFTRAQFRSLVSPFLRDVQGRRGVYDFRVVCDETNNTAEVIDQNQFRADIFLKPAKSINFITLTFVATRTGISFEELGA